MGKFREGNLQKNTWIKVIQRDAIQEHARHGTAESDPKPTYIRRKLLRKDVPHFSAGRFESDIVRQRGSPHRSLSSGSRERLAKGPRGGGSESGDGSPHVKLVMSIKLRTI